MVARTRKQLKCPMIDDWLKKLWYIYTMEYYSVIRRDEMLPFVATWMDLEIIMLSKTSQTEKAENHMISLICGCLLYTSPSPRDRQKSRMPSSA